MNSYEVSPYYSIHTATNLEVILRWEEVTDLLTRSFKDSPFNDGYGPERPIEHTREGISGHLGNVVTHILAETPDRQLIGGVFCLPAVRLENTYDTDIGWLCTAPELETQRIVVLNGLITAVKMSLTNAGYRRIVTSMGTPAGEKVISRHHGFSHDPTPDTPNRWIASLEL